MSGAIESGGSVEKPTTHAEKNWRKTHRRKLKVAIQFTLFKLCKVPRLKTELATANTSKVDDTFMACFDQEKVESSLAKMQLEDENFTAHNSI